MLPAQSVRLLIAPPWLVRVLRIALVALLAALIVRLVRGDSAVFRRAARRRRSAARSCSAALSIAAPARAQTFPPDELLERIAHRI